MPASSLFTDHPAWALSADAGTVRVMRSPSGTWLATWSSKGLRLDCIEGSNEQRPAEIHTSAAQLSPNTPAALTTELGSLGTVIRLANSSLWDAMSTAILRQVITAKQARLLYRNWCAVYGTPVSTSVGTLYLAPDPETVLKLADEEFAAIKATFFQAALRSAAQDFLSEGDSWSKLEPAPLVEALIGIRRIGPWTARAAVADYTGEFSVYPVGDLAVRTWAKAAAPSVAWPTREKDFESAWRAYASDEQQLHALTMLTLTWGNHVHHDPSRSDRLF